MSFYERKKWAFYDSKVESGFFKESNEDGFEDYTDKQTYEEAVNYFGLDDAMKLIDCHEKAKKDFTMTNMLYAYDYIDWRS